MKCGDFPSCASNLHFDHVYPASKVFHIGRLMAGNVAMSNQPQINAFVNLQDRVSFLTVYDALFTELHKLALLCSICHAKKTYAETEILFLIKIGNFRVRRVF